MSCPLPFSSAHSFRRLSDVHNCRRIGSPRVAGSSSASRSERRVGSSVSRDLVGKTACWDGRFEAVAASYFIRARFKADVEHPQHFTTFMNLSSMKRRLAEMARGAVGQANINAKELRSIKLPLPPFTLQEEFAGRVAEIRELEVRQKCARQQLDDLFKSMLHRAFTGEI